MCPQGGDNDFKNFYILPPASICTASYRMASGGMIKNEYDSLWIPNCHMDTFSDHSKGGHGASGV